MIMQTTATQKTEIRALYDSAVQLKNQVDALVGSIMSNCPALFADLPENEVKKIQMIVALHFQQKPQIMTSKRRTEAVAWPRQIAMFLCREFLDCTLEQLGRMFGNRDHGTIVHGVQLVQARCEAYPEVLRTVVFLRQQISSALNKNPIEILKEEAA